jgi:hypothetical protein
MPMNISVRKHSSRSGYWMFDGKYSVKKEAFQNKTIEKLACHRFIDAIRGDFRDESAFASFFGGFKTLPWCNKHNPFR